MLAGTYNIVCEQGATFTREISVINSDNTLPDYNASSGRMQVRASVTSPTVILELTNANNRVSMQDNVITLNITAEDTTVLVPGTYVYDLEIVTGSLVIRLVEGTFRVSPEVTR